MAIANSSKVAIIIGIDVSAVESGYLTMADTYVKTLLNQNFEAIQSGSIYIDTNLKNDFNTIYDGPRNFVITDFPLTEITSVIYKPDADDATTLVADTDYFVNLDSGIVTLSDDFEPILGLRTFKINYKYGFSTAPADVIDFASYKAAFLQESKTAVAKNDAGAVLNEVEIGRYREKYSSSTSVLKAKYGDFLDEMEDLLIQKYKIWE